MYVRVLALAHNIDLAGMKSVQTSKHDTSRGNGNGAGSDVREG